MRKKYIKRYLHNEGMTYRGKKIQENLKVVQWSSDTIELFCLPPKCLIQVR